MARIELYEVLEISPFVKILRGKTHAILFIKLAVLLLSNRINNASVILSSMASLSPIQIFHHPENDYFYKKPYKNRPIFF